MNPSDKPSSKPADLAQLDALTGGAFTAPTSGERAARLRDWLANDPSHETMAEVYRELGARDKGAAKVLKERLDDIKRSKAQDAIAQEWAAKAQALLAQPRLNLADAMAWQRDAAKAGAPLSREPLTGLKQALAERMKALEDLQHRVSVEREAAVLLAQRIEVLSTKPWAEAQAALDVLRADVAGWRGQADVLVQDPVWSGLDPKFPTQLDASRLQLVLVWEAFEAAVAQAVAAASDVAAPLPAVPVWADELRALRGESVPDPVEDTAERVARRAQAEQVVGAALEALLKEVGEGHAKATPKAATDVRQVLKDHGRHISPELDSRVQATLARAGELEGQQRWRADQLREELVTKAVALTQSPEGQKLGGRKVQETLRTLREQWKATDQGGAPNHGLWRKFDDACNQAHKVVEAWLGKVKEQNEAHRAQRLALIEEVKAWTLAQTTQATQTDWKSQLRDLHTFAERWRESGHLSEKVFAELQPLWKAAIAAAHEPLETAQAESHARRKALIQEAQTLAADPQWRVDAVKALQQRWQQEAHSVPLDRRQEQKLWEAFRQPIDEAFARKSTEREKATAALSAHDQGVLDAARSVEQACADGDVARIQAAVEALRRAGRAEAPPPAAPVLSDAAAVPVPAVEDAAPATEDVAPAAAPPRKLVAMRGDDRPGMTKAVPASGRPPGRDSRDSRDGRGRTDNRGTERRDSRPNTDGRPPFDARAPRLGDAAFRAQRQAMEQAEFALKKLASQAHGEALTQLLQAWQQRDAALLPAAQALGGRAAAAARASWAQALSAPSQPSAGAEQPLLRLEMAAEWPTPAEHQDARRALQLQLLTRRHDPAPKDTWAQDAAAVLASAQDAATARRLQAVLKVLLRR